LSPNENVFCTLETNDSRRTQIRPTLFVLARTLKEQRSQTPKRKTVLDLSPSEDVFCNLKTNDARRRQIRPALFVLVRRLQEQMPHP
jgi:hypothetical protein